jgi:ABC-type transport system substrate-binding protein
MLLGGQAHISDLTPLQAEQIAWRGTEGKKDVNLLSYYAGQQTWLQLGGIINPEGKYKDAYDSSIPWVGDDSFSENSIKVRKAMNLAIDRKGIVTGLLRGQGRPLANGITFDVPGAGWYNPAWKPHEYQPELAKQLMTEAGYPDGFKMNAWVYELGNAVLNDDIMVAVAGMWEKDLNIKVNLKRAEYNPTVRQHFFTRTFGDHALTYSGTGVFLTFRAAQLVMCSTCPLAYFEVPAVDALVAKLNATLEPTGPEGYNAFTRQIGDVMYEKHLTFGVVESKVFWGLRADTVGTWDRNQYETGITDLEYVTRSA